MTTERIDIVKERLLFITNLTNSRENFRGTHLLQHVGENGWDHPYRHFAALRFYLLLTCFDILGQSDDYIDFYSWLESKRHASEREKIFETFKDNDRHSFLTSVYKEYNQKYGVSNSFFKFINLILSTTDRERLYHSIKIQKIDSIKKTEIPFEGSEKMKRDFLYLVRNSFTHKGKSLASPSGGIFKSQDDDAPTFLPGESTPKWGYELVYKEDRKEVAYHYSVRKWPTLLREIIESTINRPI